MSYPAQQHQIPVEEYLRGEEESEIRHEYLAGEVYAMTGTGDRHNLIAGNVFALLHHHLRRSPCQVFMADMKVRLHVDGEEWLYYPDAMVCCDAADRDPYFRHSPCLLVEVVSPSTERIDRREKLFAYRHLGSAAGYLILAQERREAVLYRGDRGWVAERYGADAVIDLLCGGETLRLPLEEVYAKTGL